MKKRMKWIFVGALLSLLLMIVPAMATASDGTWSKVSSGLPANADIRSLAIDPTNSQTLYAVASGYGVYKSTNGGGTWSAVNSGLYSIQVTSFAIAPTNSQTIYAGLDYGLGSVFKSINGGVSWSTVYNGLQPPTLSAIRTLAIDPTDSQTIYAGTDGYGVYKSTNGGNSWTAANSGMSAYYIASLVIDPNSSQTIYAGTLGVCKSTDGGNSWSAMINGLPNGWVSSVVIDPKNSQTIYAVIGTDVYKSTNGAVTWSAVRSGVAGNYVYALAIDPFNSQTIYVGTYSDGGGSVFGVYKSDDGGSTWSEYNNGMTFLASVLSLAIDPNNSQNIYAGTHGYGSGVFKLLLMPTISGTPSVNATAGNVYSFIPTATDATNFSISNKPSWASFDTTTGTLTGTPANANLGSYPNIVINANNGSLTASLPAFAITVALPPIPSISGTPATSVTAGNTYNFTPTATNATSFSISNKPTWANFNTTTGSLTGTPTNSNVGTNSNILISATNSTGTAILSAFAITTTTNITVPGAPSSISATAGNSEATVSFSLPADTGGSAITGYTVKSNPAGGTDSNAGTTAASHTITGLTNGIAYTFTCTANNTAGTGPASAISNSVIPSSSNAPVLSVSTLSNNSFTNNATLNITGTVTAANILKSLIINDTAVAVNLFGSFSAVVTLKQGANPLAIIAIDNVGKQTSDIRTINYDTTMPAITITAPADNSVTGKTFTDITGSVDDPNATVTAKINGGSSKSATMSGQNFSVSLNLISGLNTIDISATDQAGNSTSVKRTITTDIAVPTLAVTNPAQDVITSLGSITISGTVTDAVTSAIISIAVDGQTYTPTVATNGSFSQAITLPTEKTYAVVVTATDQGNNNATVQRNIIKTAALTQPTISDALKVLQAVVGITPLTATEQIRYDVAPLGSSGTPVGNGIIDAADVILILRRSIGIGSW